MSINKINILVTDDDIDYLFQMKSKLQKQGFNIITAESRKEAEHILVSFRPDLCVFDMMMEEDDSGLVLAHHCKNLYPDVPVIIATGVRSETGYSFDPESENDASWIKAELFVEKGIATEQLEIQINKLLKKKHKNG